MNPNKINRRSVVEVILLYIKLVSWEVVVAQLVERSLPIPEVRGSSPVIGKNLLISNICILSTEYWKDENKEKEARSGPFFFKKKVSVIEILLSRQLNGLSCTICPHLIKSNASHPLRTKKLEGGGRICPRRYNFFSAQYLWCLWVGKLPHFWWWSVSEVSCLCRQAGRLGQQAVYLSRCLWLVFSA